MATRKPPPRPRSQDTREQVARIVYEHEQGEFDPEEPPARYAQPHHFAVNPAREMDLEELAQEAQSVIYDPEENQDMLPFVRQQMGIRMHNWHRSQGDPVYGVGSMLHQGESTSISQMDDALGSLEAKLERERDSENRQELELLIEWLEFELEQAKMVNNPDGDEDFEQNPDDEDLEENHGHVTEVDVTFEDGHRGTVSDSQTLGRMAKRHGGVRQAYLAAGTQYQREFWNSWRGRWPRTEADIADWFNVLEHLTEDVLRVMSIFAKSVGSRR